MTKRMSIFFLARTLEIAGAERQLALLATGLRKRGHSVEVGLFYRRGSLIPEVEGSGVTIVDLRKGGRWDLLTFTWRLIRQLRRRRPDIVYSFLGSSNLIAAAVRPFVPGTRFVWSVRASNMKLSEYGRVHRIAYKAESLLSGSADLIIANSSAGAAYSIDNGFPGDKLVVIPNGIDTDRFRPDTELRRAQRRTFGLGDDDIAVGVLARLDPMKGHRIFLEAARIAAAKAPKIRFLCIGGGQELHRLERIAKELGLGGRLVFTGEQEPVAALNALDIACSCSVWGEGFSNAIAEAMACGLPCIVSDVGDSARIVGSCGKVVPPGSPEALAEAILAQAGSLDRHDREEPRARIVENFSVPAMVERTLEAFHERLRLG